MLCALIGSSNAVIGICDLQDADIQFLGRQYLVVDVTNLVPTPVIGWAFNGSIITGTSASQKLSKLSFRSRLTPTELAGIYSYAYTLPLQTYSYTVQVLLDNLLTAEYIDLARSDLQSGIGLLVSLGLITSGRQTTIMTTPISMTERWLG